MRNIKFKIRCKALNQIYISYLRPLLEYASSVWDNCNNFEKDKLEKVQLEAARIVTGTTRSTSLNNIYRETGWLTLSNRRLYQKLLIMYKIENGMVPEYLSSLFPRTMDNPVAYNLRNNDDFITYPCRTALFENPFVPSGIKAWNNLPAQIRNSLSISCFKRRLLDSYSDSSVVPKYYLHGIRNLSVIHTRLRNNCSNLNADLFNNHISLTDKCEHCQISENAEHYFFSCKKYSE